MRLENAVFTVIVGLVALAAAVVALDFRPLARIFPLTVAIGIVCFSVGHLILLALSREADEEHARPTDQASPGITQVLPYMGWLVGYMVTIWLSGFIVATALLVSTFLYFVAHLKLWQSIVAAAAALVLVLILGRALNIYWPNGWLWTLGG